MKGMVKGGGTEKKPKTKSGVISMAPIPKNMKGIQLD